MKKLLNMGYLTAMLIALGALSGQAVADDVLTGGDEVTDAAFAAGAVETDVLADERGMSAEATAGGLAVAVDAEGSVILADSDSTTNQTSEQNFNVNAANGDVNTTIGDISDGQFSNNKFSIGIFNTGPNATLGASMNVNVIFAPTAPSQ